MLTGFVLRRQQQHIGHRRRAHLRPSAVQRPTSRRALGAGGGCQRFGGQSQRGFFLAAGQGFEPLLSQRAARQLAQRRRGQRHAVKKRYAGQVATQLLLQQRQFDHAQAQAVGRFGQVYAAPTQLGDALP